MRASTTKGPCSENMPISDEEPGPGGPDRRRREDRKGGGKAEASGVLEKAEGEKNDTLCLCMCLLAVNKCYCKPPPHA